MSTVGLGRVERSVRYNGDMGISKNLSTVEINIIDNLIRS